MNILRLYQKEVAQAVLDSVYGLMGLTFCFEIIRSGGKTEFSI